MVYELLRQAISMAVVIVLLLCGMAWRVMRGHGRKPVSPMMAIMYRGKTTGTIESVNREGRVAIISYEVGGRRYRYIAPYRTRGHASSKELPDSVRLSTPMEMTNHEVTSLGLICPGGSISIRYDVSDPSDAVVVPNPNGIRS